ncbi:CDP-archaeol synthase [Caldimonas sp. KR1-144]|uniref:CDP-archaeol synthase n=1 Tax=Caldimonas sp. KR1-144 TaxID=3400911 RepID=UPI003C115194
METLWLAVRLLLLLGVANTAPIAAKRWLGPRWSRPVDGGLVFVDGRPLLGPSKTWRGVAAAVIAGALAAPLLGLAPWIGAVIGAAAMAGDALSSFIKRRLGIASSGRATGLDQIPEALLPLLAVQQPLALSPALIAGVTLAFFALELPIARWSYRRGLRDRPY